MKSLPVVSFFLALVILLGLPMVAGAATLTVTTATDELDVPAGANLSLREAVRDAAAGDTIVFAAGLSGQTITLLQALGGEIVVAKDLTFDASSLAAGLTISGGGTSRIFSVGFGQNVALTGLTLTGGNGTGVTLSGNGGALFSQGTLTLSRCTFTGNTANNGAGVYSSATATVDSCTFSANTGAGSGGGMFSVGTLTMSRSTFSGNTVNNNGGALLVFASTAMLENCTLTGNAATGGTAGGGGLFAASAMPTIKNCIVAGNTATKAGEANIGGLIVQTGANLTSGDPLVAPLGSYGGPTQTHAVLPASLARNAAIGSTFSNDQRGFPIVGPADIGAYEAGTLATNYNAFIWESLPTVGNGTISDPQHAPTFDYDRDGQSNVNEWLALTAPADATSFLHATQVLLTGNDVHLTFPSVSGRHYTFESTPDLVTWTPIPGTPFTGTGTELAAVLGPYPDVPKLFFRIRVGP